MSIWIQDGELLSDVPQSAFHALAAPDLFVFCVGDEARAVIIYGRYARRGRLRTLTSEERAAWAFWRTIPDGAADRERGWWQEIDERDARGVKL